MPSWPTGVQTTTITFGKGITVDGNVTSATLTVTPVFNGTKAVKWGADSTPLLPFVITSTAAAGAYGAVQLPVVDQAGWKDDGQHDYTLWAYKLEELPKYGTTVGVVRTKYVQPLTGQTAIDFDDIPDGSVGLPASAPVVPVSSVAGLTGAITVEQLVQAGVGSGGVGGGSVSSVNSKTGAVVLAASDVGADPAGTAAGITLAGLGGITPAGVDTKIATQAAADSATYPKSPDYTWIGGCFRGASGKTQMERLWLMTSTDGLDWKMAATNYTPTSGTVRDPDFYWDSSTLWIVHTTIGFNPGNSFAVAKWDGSVDDNNLPIITPVTTVTIPATTTRCWAPQWFIDNGNIYVYVSVDGPAVVSVSPTSADMTTWSTPVTVPGTGDIDMCAIKTGSTYRFFTSNSSSTLKMLTSTSPLGPLTVVGMDPMGAGSMVEAPTIVLLPDGVTYRLYADHHNLARTLFTETTDFATWTTPQAITTGLGSPRHMGVARASGLHGLGTKVAAASAKTEGTTSVSIFPDAAHLSTLTNNQPSANAARAVSFTPDRDMLVGSASFEVTTAGSSNEGYEIVLYDSQFSRLATTGTGTSSTAPTNTTGLKTRAFTGSARLRKGNRYFVAMAWNSTGGTGCNLRALSLGATYKLVQDAAALSQAFILNSSAAIYGSAASITNPQTTLSSDALGHLLVLNEV